MDKFSKDLKKNVKKIINHEEKEIIPLTNEEDKLYRKKKVCYICKNEFDSENEDNGIASEKKYHKVRIIIIKLANIEALIISFVT